MQAQRKTIAIIGGGPSGSTLATLLAKKGHKVGMYHLAKRPPLIVGESLLPSVIPVLRLLGVEDEVKAFSTYKPGATMCLGIDNNLPFGFNEAKTSLSYAYNVPRDKFDEVILNAAMKAGVKIMAHRALVEVDAETGKLKLHPDTLEAAEGFFDEGLDLIVDATGRTRYLPKLLDLPSEEGARKDTALFAHHEGVEISDPGNIHVDLHEKGWGWRIPLPGKVSLGIVLDPKHLDALGKTKEEQYDAILKMDPMLAGQTQNAKRISPVMAYNNYQWKSKQLFGNGWALTGDAAGFIDPVFSTGLYLAMDSSVRLADAIEKGDQAAFENYQSHILKELKGWQHIIDHWYNGKLSVLFEMKNRLDKKTLGALLNAFIARHVSRIFTGEVSSNSFSHKLLSFMFKYGIPPDADIEYYTVK